MNLCFYHFAKISLISLIITLCIACDGQNKTQIGYIEAEYTYIAGNVSGTLLELAVQRGQKINKGDLLYRLDPEPETSSVQAALANINNLAAQVDFYKTQLERQQYLLQQNATSKMEVERAQINYDSYVQQLAANKANLIQTQWTLNQKTLVAPVSGEIFDTFYQVGENVNQYKPVLAILDPQNIKVIFFLGQDQLSQIQLGQVISFTCDGCDGKTLATVSYISPAPEYTPPVIYSKDIRKNLVYMIRASMPPELARKFHPGQPVDVYIDHE